MTKQLNVPAAEIVMLITLQLVLLALFAVSNESLWIDEFASVKFATMPTFQSLWLNISESLGSSAQTPLYYFYLFGWEKVFGSGEYALRAANLPLMAMAEGAMLWALKDSRRMFFGFLFLSTFHAMLWYYMNEARPYIMMYSGACMLVAACIKLYRLESYPRRAPGIEYWLFAIGAIVLAGSSMLGAPWLASAAGFVCLLDSTCKYQLTRKNALIPLTIMVIVIAALGIYYLRTLLNQAGGSHLNKTTFLSLAFSAYEIMGLSGLGPGRLELRGSGVANLPEYLFALATVGAGVATATYWGLKSTATVLGIRRFVITLVLLLMPVLLISIGGVIMHWRVVGRHIVPILPVILLLLTIGVLKLGESRQIIGRAVALVLVGGFAISAFTMGMNIRHKKEDYRLAARIATTAAKEGGAVWWAAHQGVAYYDLKFDHSGDKPVKRCPAVLPGKIVAAPNVARSCARNADGPDLLILSKPETFDTNNALPHWVSEHRYVLTDSFPGFWIYRSNDYSTRESD